VTASPGPEDPYRSPQVLPGRAVAAASPWRRFWLSCLGWFLPVPLAVMLSLYLAPDLIVGIVVGVAVLWLATVAWVARANRNGNLAQRAAVVLGLTASLAISCSLGSALLLAPLVNIPIEIELPQR
jgi:hypothetical protein